MSELNIKMVPLSAIDYAINEASEGWNQFLDTEEMKVVAIPEDPEEMDDLYIPDEEIEKLVIEDKEGRFLTEFPFVQMNNYVVKINKAYNFYYKIYENREGV